MLTPCSPSGAGQGTGRLPKARCPLALLTSEDGVCGVEAVVVQEQPFLSPPLTKNKPCGVSTPHPVDRGQGMGGNTQATAHSAWWGGPGDPEEGTSSVNVTGMQTPVSQERRGCSLPESLAASGSQAEASTDPTQPPAVSGELHSAQEQVKTTSNQTHARQLFAHVSRRLPDALAAEFLSSLGRGRENIYIFICRGPRRVRSPLRPHLSASMVTLAFCSALACWETAAGQPAGWAGAAGVHMLCCCPGGEAVGQAGLKAPCWGSGGAGGGGEVAMEATGLLLLKLSEALRRENMVRASGKLGGVAGVLAGVHII